MYSLATPTLGDLWQLSYLRMRQFSPSLFPRRPRAGAFLPTLGRNGGSFLRPPACLCFDGQSLSSDPRTARGQSESSRAMVESQLQRLVQSSPYAERTPVPGPLQIGDRQPGRMGACPEPVFTFEPGTSGRSWLEQGATTAHTQGSFRRANRGPRERKDCEVATLPVEFLSGLRWLGQTAPVGGMR